MKIDDIQKVFILSGVQWLEHIFHKDDGISSQNNCYLLISNSKDYSVFNHPRSSSVVGWGRFSREYCWERAYQYFLEYWYAGIGVVSDISRGSGPSSHRDISESHST